MMKTSKIYYETFGNPKDPCIILIMGIGGQLIHWPPVFITGLVEKGFFVVTFDNRDSGLSQQYDHVEIPSFEEAIKAKEQRRGLQVPYTLEDMASDVIALMEKLTIKKAHIIGMSMGGMIAQLVALNYPEHVLSLTCIASTTGDPTLPPAKAEIVEYFFSEQRREEDLAGYVNNKLQLYKLYNHPDHVDEKKIRELYTKTYHRAHNSSGFKRQLLALIFTKPWIERLKTLQVTTLIIHGDYDPAFPIQHGKHLAKLIPNSRLEIIPKMGHGVPSCLSGKLVELIFQHVIRF